MSEEKIREIALEFFKDKFGVMYEKQKELEKKFNSLKDYDLAIHNKERIESLEKDYGNCFSVGAGERHRLRIEKLEASSASHTGRLNTQRDAINNRNYKSIVENKQELAELKEQVSENQKWLKTGRSIALCNVKNDYAWKHINLNREVLRELMNRLQDIVKDDFRDLIDKLDGDSKYQSITKDDKKDYIEGVSFYNGKRTDWVIEGGEQSDSYIGDNKSIVHKVPLDLGQSDSKPPKCEFYDMNADYCTKYDLRGS